MLLDRRRINKWAKWVALGLAIVFAVSFLGLGVGSGTGLHWSDLWGGGGGAGSGASGKSAEEQIKIYEDELAKDPNNRDALLAMATLYERDLDQRLEAAKYLEQAAKLLPETADIYLRLAGIYMHSDVRDYANAARVLKKATALNPNYADAFLQLGVAERSLGNDKAAILAWNRYLELAPDSEMAPVVRDQIKQMINTPAHSGTSTTTTTAG